MPVKSLSLSFRRGTAHPQLKPGRSESQPNGATTTPFSTSSCTIPDGNQDILLCGIGLYKFVGSLGNGKFSRVVLAQHVETGKQVAVKIIDKQAHDYRVMSRLVREVYLMEMLDHENIVKLYETYETCDSLFLVMEYIPGMNLDEYLNRKGGALTEDEARQLFRQLVSAVYFCHNRWVVHRDLKTPNILITPDGTVKLADFGLGNRFGLQRLKTICGSMLYYSPEIITGQKYFGPEVDCWCLGIALFRMTAGFEPFSHAHTVGELKKAVCSCNYPMPDSLSPELQTTIRKCLQTDRRKRMTVRQALKDDPWLTNFGKLPCPFANVPKTAYDEVVGDDDQAQISSADRAERERRARRQFMKDLERSQQVENEVKRTLIYHPINPSTYFTATPTQHNSTNTTNSQQHQHQHHHHHHFHQHHYHYQHQTIEVLRSKLLQSIKARARKLGMRSAERWESLSIRSPLNLRFKGNNGGGDNKKLSFLQRFTKDQVYYFHLGRPVRRGSDPPSLSSSDSTSTSSLSSVVSIEHTESHQHQQQRGHLAANDKGNIIALVKQTCQLMGVTYFQETPTRLVCVLTLRDTPKKEFQQKHAKENGHQGPPPSSNVRRRTSHNSTHSTATSATTTSASELGSSTGDKEPHRLKRLSMPLISHLTSSMTTSFFARTKLQQQQQQQQQQQRTGDQHHPVVTRSQKKDGMAIFTIEFEVRSPNSSLVALRFSKQHGSTTVFKMACGWVTGVIGLNH